MRRRIRRLWRRWRPRRRQRLAGPPGREHLGLGVSTLALGGVGLMIFGAVLFVGLAYFVQRERR